ncbi:MAG: flippase-like domain-containing protein [Bdellovibrionales bacterium]|nr:flippase-like domain-containing protein [Bdellovibrionales bacterium]
MTAKLKKYTIQFAKLLFDGGLLYWMLAQGNLDINSFKNILTPSFVVICYLLVLLMLNVNNMRWWLLLKARHFTTSYLNTLSLTFIGLFFNFVMPGSVGGDVIKGYYICKDHPERKIDAAFTILMDRVIGIFAMLSLALIGILISWQNISHNMVIVNLFWFMLILFFVILFVFVFFLLQNNQAKWIKKVEATHFVGIGFIIKVLRAFQAYRNNVKVIILTFVFSLMSQLLAVAMFAFVGEQLGEELSFAAYMFAVALGFITSAVPISPGGVGVGQVAFFFFFKTYTGQDLQVGSIGITIQQATMFSLGLIGGLLYLRTSKSQTQIEELTA